MGPNPYVGVLYHWIGGLAAASFYIPYKAVRHWSWETYWLVGGIFSWILAPIIFAFILVPDLPAILTHAPTKAVAWAFFWGLMWGIGGLTFGLSMRYLGIALGYAIALGLCAAFGTIMPPLFNGDLARLGTDHPLQVVLLGVAVCLVGIAISGLAGMSKESELSDDQKKGQVSEFNFLKGLIVAMFAGVMSASFAYGLSAGKPIAQAARQSLIADGRVDLWQNLPVLIIVLLGGFITNFLWCLILNIKNRSGGEYYSAFRTRDVAELSAIEGVMNSDLHQLPYQAVAKTPEQPVPLAWNYLFSALAGITWYFQFFFYSMGQTKMGKYDFSSWTLHMASIIIFSTLWGIALREWHGTSKRTHVLIGAGLAVLIGSTVIIGYGTHLQALAASH